ncbi:MAG: DUF5069 domain-containing protein [Opitutaceae bacterium]|nr:DUF5069 domain-containing protein [Opitutaceae bacterium]
MSTTLVAPDLTQRPPRSPRVRLGGFVILPRTIDKGRASLAGRIGEYHFDCPLDKRFLTFVGIEGSELLEQLRQGKSDTEILAWVRTHGRNQRTESEIAAWSAQQEIRTPDTPEYKERFAGHVARLAPQRTDILTSFDLLDVDDHVTFGGAA